MEPYNRSASVLHPSDHRTPLQYALSRTGAYKLMPKGRRTYVLANAHQANRKLDRDDDKENGRLYRRTVGS
jgi:hypothetical protein